MLISSNIGTLDVERNLWNLPGVSLIKIDATLVFAFKVRFHKVSDSINKTLLYL